MTHPVPADSPSPAPRVLTQRHGNVLAIGLNRPEKRNAADAEMLSALALAYGELQRDPEMRVGLVHAVGDHFTGGLDLADVAPRIGPDGLDVIPAGGIDPWQLADTTLTKPIVVAVQGVCLTLGIELILAADVAVAADDARFGQIEVARGILPFGGATLRFPRRCGWGNAMRWLLTGDMFDAAEAYRMGLVQQIVPAGRQFDAALALAQRIAAQAPLAVQATLANAKLAVRTDDTTAARALQPELVRLAGSEDAAIGMRAFLSRSEPEFTGR